MTDDELLRYSRHILLDAVGVEGQQRALNGHALVIGAGGLGSPVALYLAASGVGRITLVDDDRVDLTNLQRQIAHTQDRIGQSKVESAQQAMRALNPQVQVHTHVQRADDAFLNTWVPQADVVIDGSDNFDTRQRINAACVQHGVPLISGSVLGFDGQFSVYDPRQPDSPCYACLFPPDTPPPEVRCATMGVLAPLVGVIGTLQATEAVKLLAGVGRSLAGRLQLLDGRSLEWTEMRLRRQVDCPVCQHRPG